MFNSFGNILRLTSFGESHGKGVGGVIVGFPAGIVIDMDFVQAELDRRRPGQSRITTARKEGDKVEFLSGIFEGKSTGCPIGFIVWNQNQHSDDYNNLKEVYRPSHADYTCEVYAVMCIPSCFSANLASAPATTREIVSRADERPPPRWSRMPYFTL